MKTISASIFLSGDQWWYRQANGTRQRAAIKTCETCDDEFATYPSGETRFCSPECWRRPCKRCGETFTPRTKRTVYCSRPCQRGTGACENCGKTYVFSHHGAKRFCSLSCHNDFACPVGTVRPQTDGYTITKVPSGTDGTKRAYGANRNGWMATHRYVMQQKLGRPLIKGEEVHHLNGRRDDNRPENLELWKKSQPAGVRSKDYHCAGCRCQELACQPA